MNIGRRHNLKYINIFNDDRTLNSNTGSFEGQKRRYTVVAELKAKGLFVKEEDNAMVLKLSDRSKDVIETPQWWMKMRELADEAIKVVQTGEITIFPLSEKKKYFRWMQDIDDWCVSRQLWWGHRAPAYVRLSISSISPFRYGLRQIYNNGLPMILYTTTMSLYHQCRPFHYCLTEPVLQY